MPIRSAIWKVSPQPQPLAESSLANEKLLEDMIVRDPSILEWFTKQSYLAKGSESDLIYVNGGNKMENIETSGDLRKVRLVEVDFHRLMVEMERVMEDRATGRQGDGGTGREGRSRAIAICGFGRMRWMPEWQSLK